VGPQVFWEFEMAGKERTTYLRLVQQLDWYSDGARHDALNKHSDLVAIS